MQPSWTGGAQPIYPQNTGYPFQPQQHYGGGGFVHTQPTGYQQPMQLPQQPSGYAQYAPQASNPLLGAFASSFMQQLPSQGPQQVPQGLPLYFQQQNMAHAGQSQVQVQWALTPDERKSYGQIFRQWADSKGYISGARAQEVFRESGLARPDLMKIWALADVEDRGRLNLAEFEVAMGLIYRKLSGNPIPDVLPQDLIPPSSKDLDTSVDFLKDLLRNDTHSRSTNLDANQSSSQSNKYAKVRSFNRNASPEPSSVGPQKDAAVYKHDDGDVKTYKSSSRHLDRRNVRFQGDDETSDLSSLKKQLEDTQELLDRTYKNDNDRDDVDAEIEDLKYRIRRVQEDIEFNKSGRRTEGKDNERRRLERELLFLMHEKLPELEERVRDRNSKKQYEDVSAARSRDQRNQGRSYGRRDHDDRGRLSPSSSDEGKDHNEREHFHGSHRTASAGSSGRSDAVSMKAQRETPDSRFTVKDPTKRGAAQTPPPVTAVMSPTPRLPHPPPVPEGRGSLTENSSRNSTPSSEHRKPQTAEERQAYIRAEAQRRVQERMRMLTGQSPSTSPAPSEPTATGYDSSLQARLEQDKREAARRAEDDDRAASERERFRQIKLEEERQKKLAAEQSIVRTSAEALHKVADEVTASEMKQPNETEGIASSAAHEELAREERHNREREQRLSFQQQESQARVQKLTENIPRAPKIAPPPPLPRVHKAPPKPPPSRKHVVPTQERVPPSGLSSMDDQRNDPLAAGADLPQTTQAQASVSPAPMSPRSNTSTAGVAASPVHKPSPPSMSPPVKSGVSTNPFHRLGNSTTTMAVPANGAPKGVSNPFFRPPTGATTSSTAPNKPPAAQPVIPNLTSKHEEDWGDARDLEEADSDDSDDEEGPSVKQMRAGLAGLLFGGNSAPTSSPPSRPASTQPESVAAPAIGSAHATTGPLPPLGAAAGNPPPRAALLGAIQGGAKLRKTTTVDKSVPPGAGHVVPSASGAATGHTGISGLIAPPSTQSSGLVPQQTETDESQTAPESERRSENRQSVDWFGGLAADRYPSPTFPTDHNATLASVEEADETSSFSERVPASIENADTTTSGITTAVDEGKNASDDPAMYFDMTKSSKVRSLYSYDAQREQDAAFRSNLLIIAHPAKDSRSDWLYGIVPATGSRGWLPKSYVEELELSIPAKVIYDFEGSTEDELKVSAGTSLFICDKVDAHWVRAVLDGHVGLVPAAYLEEENQGMDRALSMELLFSAGPPMVSGHSSSQLESPKPAMVDGADSDSNSEDSDGSWREETSVESREIERLRVLKAAGLVIQKADTKASRRRPPPPRPRPSLAHSGSGLEEQDGTEHKRPLEALPASEHVETINVMPVDDAYARWQALKDGTSAVHGNASTMSVGQVFIGTVDDSGLFEMNTFPEHADSVLDGERGRPSEAGKTWSSLVNAETLCTIPEKARKRQEAIFELIKTEESFLDSVQMTIKVWFAQLQPLLDQRETTVIFANIEDITLWSATFFSDLESRQKECRLYIDTIGDIVKQYSASLDIYRPYCLNQANAIRVLAECRKRNEDVDRIASMRRHGLTLEHFLLEPFQRLARYPLLFKQILHYTDDDDPDATDLKLGIRNAQLVLNRTNQQLTSQANEQQLAYLSEHLAFADDETLGLDLTAPTRLGQPRVLLKEGELVKGYNHRRQSKRKTLRAYLFNDMLLLTTQTLSLKDRLASRHAMQEPDAIYVYKAPMPIDEISVHTSAEDDSVLIIEHKGLYLKLQANTTRQCVEWVRVILEIRAKYAFRRPFNVHQLVQRDIHHGYANVMATEVAPI